MSVHKVIQVSPQTLPILFAPPPHFEGIFHPEDFMITLDMYVLLERAPQEEQLCH